MLVQRSEIDSGEGDAAGGVDQHSVPGVADAAPDRTLDVGVGVEGCADEAKRAAKRKNGAGDGLAEARAVDVAFEADNELGQLQVIADVSAADDATAVIADAVEQAEAVAEVSVLGAPRITDLGADIDAGPGEDRNRRHIDRRRRRRAEIGRQRRRGQRDHGDRCHFKVT